MNHPFGISGTKEWANTFSIIDSTFFESSITQIRAFIDFSQRLAAVSLGILKPINNTKDFYHKLRQINGERSKTVIELFQNMDENWGNSIREIRDKILHYDIIKTGHEYRPKIDETTYEKSIQTYGNHAFQFLVLFCETVFEVKWVAGTFNEFKKYHKR